MKIVVYCRLPCAVSINTPVSHWKASKLRFQATIMCQCSSLPRTTVLPRLLHTHVIACMLVACDIALIVDLIWLELRCISGSLGLVHKVQQRILRSHHVDSHYCAKNFKSLRQYNAMLKKWLVKADCLIRFMFVSSDDKANVCVACSCAQTHCMLTHSCYYMLAG